MSVLLCDSVTSKNEQIKNFQFNFLEKQTYGLIDYSLESISTFFLTISGKKKIKSGTVWIDGQSLGKNHKLKKKIFYFPVNKNYYFKTPLKIFNKMNRKCPKWDHYFALECAYSLELPLNKAYFLLNTEEKEILKAICTLCSRANISIYFDPLFSVDEKRRNIFFSLVNAHKEKYPRTNIIYSKHLDSISSLLDKVLFLDSGKLISIFGSEKLKESFSFLTGKEETIKPLVRNLSVIGTEQKGDNISVCVATKLSKDEIRKFQKYQIQINSVPIQKIYAYFLALRENRSSTIEAIYKK